MKLLTALHQNFFLHNLKRRYLETTLSRYLVLLHWSILRWKVWDTNVSWNSTHGYQTNQPINYWKSFITCVIFVQSSWNLIWNFISSFSIIWERLVKEWTIILPTSTTNPKFAYSRYGRWGPSYQLGWFAAGWCGILEFWNLLICLLKHIEIENG